MKIRQDKNGFDTMILELWRFDEFHYKKIIEELFSEYKQGKIFTNRPEFYITIEPEETRHCLSFRTYTYTSNNNKSAKHSRISFFPVAVEQE